MELNPEEVRSGTRWFFGAGITAVLLCFALYGADNMLTYSTREKDLGSRLKELRSAQFGLHSSVSDERLKVEHSSVEVSTDDSGTVSPGKSPPVAHAEHNEH